MKFIHTADWHFGKTLRGASLIDDQAYISEEFFKIVDERKPDVVIIAGDVYDRGVPSADAVELFNEFLSKLTERKTKIVCISGNHDSATRLNFGSSLFEKSGFFLRTQISENPEPIIFQDDFGDVYFAPIPFFEPGLIRAKFFPNDTEKRLSFDEANKIYIDALRDKIPAGKRSVAVAHVFISGETKTDSVREIVGGADGISAAHFKDFNYTALGHLHAPRAAGGEFVRYSGSPLKYSFDEAAQNKSVTLVEMGADGNPKIETIEFVPRRDVRVVEGTLDELLNLEKTEDYIRAVVKGDTSFVNVADRLSYVFPNLLATEREERIYNSEEISDPTNSVTKLSISDQFAEFFSEMTGEPLSDEQLREMENFLSELQKNDNDDNF